jgi:hypothetical protein
MTTSPLPPAPDWLRDLAAAQSHYQEHFGWPVAIRVAERHLTLPLGRLMDAITMPADLAGRVYAQLGIAMLAGPVIAGSGEWTFLTQTADGTIVDGLADRGVHHATTGAFAVIPMDPTGWIAEPRPHQMLPSAYAVVATARRICAI